MKISSVLHLFNPHLVFFISIKIGKFHSESFKFNIL